MSVPGILLGGSAAPASPAHAAPPAPPVAVPGTAVTTPATRPEFTSAERNPLPRRHWRISDVLAAIGGGPRAEALIESAARPGPVEPGSLVEAIKLLRPAPKAPGASRLV